MNFGDHDPRHVGLCWNHSYKVIYIPYHDGCWNCVHNEKESCSK